MAIILPGSGRKAAIYLGSSPSEKQTSDLGSWKSWAARSPWPGWEGALRFCPQGPAQPIPSTRAHLASRSFGAGSWGRTLLQILEPWGHVHSCSSRGPVMSHPFVSQGPSFLPLDELCSEEGPWGKHEDCIFPAWQPETAGWLLKVTEVLI